MQLRPRGRPVGPGLVLGLGVAAAGPAAAEEAEAPPLSCRALVAPQLDLGALQRGLARGDDPNGTCPVTKMVRRQLSFVEVLMGAIIPPIGLMMVLDDRRSPRTRQVPLIALAVGQRSGPAVAALLAAGADPLKHDPYGTLPLRAGVMADLEGSGARWTDQLLGSRRLPPLAFCKDTALLDGLWDHPDLRSRLELAGLAEGGRDCDGRTWLHRAAADRDGARVAALLDAAVVPVDARDEQDRTAAFLAARAGAWDVVDQLLAAGARPQGAGGRQGSLLHEAVRAGKADRIPGLLAAGQPVDARAESGRTPLQLAVGRGAGEIVALLLAAGADPRADGKDGARILASAVRAGDPDTVAALLGAGLSPDATTGFGQDMFDLAYDKEALGVARALAAAGGRPGRRLGAVGRADRSPALARALREGKADWVALLLPLAGADERQDALIELMIGNHLGPAAQLLDAGTDGGPALVWMATWGHEDRADWLLQRGARYPEDALDIMVPEAPYSRVREALDQGASPLGSASPWRDSPVHLAVVDRHAPLVALLVGAGAPLPVNLWDDALFEQEESWALALVSAGLPVDRDTLRLAVRRDRPAVLAAMLPVAGLSRPQLRRLRVRAWWTGASPAVQETLAAALATGP